MWITIFIFHSFLLAAYANCVAASSFFGSLLAYFHPFQAAKGVRAGDAVPVALVFRAAQGRRFVMNPAAGIGAELGVGGERLALALFELFSGTRHLQRPFLTVKFVHDLPGRSNNGTAHIARIKFNFKHVLVNVSNMRIAGN